MTILTSGMLGPADTVEWATPQDLFDLLDREFHFTLDVCASEGLQKCAMYYTPEVNGLAQRWNGYTCFMNPPYGREIYYWVRKAALSDTVVVGLLPARTDTRWYKEWVEPYASEVRFIKGRVRFGEKGPAPFPSLVAVWGTPRTPRYGYMEYERTTVNDDREEGHEEDDQRGEEGA